MIFYPKNALNCHQNTPDQSNIKISLGKETDPRHFRMDISRQWHSGWKRRYN